tara:strand:- start:5026 stop:6222 length:1197 start_codon:yes stop_codon:yes gene_type:complete
MTPEEIQALLEKKFENVQAKLQTMQESGEATKEDMDAVTASIEKQGNALEEFIQAQEKKIVQSLQVEVKNFLVNKHDEIQTMLKSGSGVIEFVPKAVAPMTTGSGTDVVQFPAVAHNNLGSMNLRNDEVLMNLATVSSTGSPVLSYTELEPKDGDYTFVAEGTEKPQIDFKWVNRFATPKKIAAYEILTEEAVTDIVRLESVAREYLSQKHGLFKASNLYFGSGVGEIAKGATVVGRTFVAGGMALQIAAPNFMDVVNACITDIYTTHNYTDESSYEANTVLINPVDFFLNLVSAKDTNGSPLYPQAGLFNQVTIGGVTIKPWSKIPAGKIFVADMKKMNVVNYVPFSIRIGWINDQFITNMFTMLGESRYFQYVKKLDEQAFIYDDIATIKTAITTA